MKTKKDWWSKISIIFNGSPLFTGDAWSGESEIRRWIIENDMLEAIIWLPDQLFYNTWIFTYIWVLNNNKEQKRKWKVQMIDARQLYTKMRKSLWNKRNEITYENRIPILDSYMKFEESEISKIFNNSDFLFRQRKTIETQFSSKWWKTRKSKDSILFYQLLSYRQKNLRIKWKMNKVAEYNIRKIENCRR